MVSTEYNSGRRTQATDSPNSSEGNVSDCPDALSVFLGHYDWLHRWALVFVRGIPFEAEDLVQELYLRLARRTSFPSFTDADHLRAYFYRALRNLSISRGLRAQRIYEHEVHDFSSVESVLADRDRSHLPEVRCAIADVFVYVCERRWTSKAATVFIMRYLLDISVPEIMALLLAKRSAIHTLLNTGRAEVRDYLNGGLRSCYTARKVPISSSQNLWETLGEYAFSGSVNHCPSRDSIVQRYKEHAKVGLTTAEAAHLTSCKACLIFTWDQAGLILPAHFGDKRIERVHGGKRSLQTLEAGSSTMVSWKPKRRV